MKSGENYLRPDSMVAAVTAIAATYGYFLLFAEFAFLELAKPLFGGELALRPLLAVLGAGGMIGSLLAARNFSLARFRPALAGGFMVCAGSAALALVAGRTGLWLAAAGVGLSLGWTTVTLSAGLRATVGGPRLGFCCGLGTGLAYAVCNIPAVFEASPVMQTGIALLLASAGAIAASRMQPGPRVVASESDHTPVGWFTWGVIFLALVWLDSAGFYILQHTPELRAQTWNGTWILFGNSLTHLLGAVLAGWALDKHRLGLTALLAFVFLAGADLLLRAGGTYLGARVAYTVGVSAYSVALVYYPAFGARPGVAAGLFAVAGWTGSALGIGMVQDLHLIPPSFIALAGGIVGAALILRQRRLHRSAALALTALVALGLGHRVARADDALIARGREVYLAEGCINCHSQFLRPGVAQEILWWGPARPLEEILAETPPLLGLRRQGPDLTNIGNRRTPEWQRLHLIAPGDVSPGSRMPAYARLFAPDDGRGDALVAYLASLGAGTLPARLEQAAGWTPSDNALQLRFDETKTRGQFLRLCASCHGPAGRGDGPLAAQLTIKPPDFSLKAWRHLRADEPAPLVAAARIIKFGLPGSVMAGHEYLGDETVVALSRYVAALHH